jgi:hypothetical protein
MIKMTSIAIILAAGAFLLGAYPYEIGLLLPYVLLAGVAAVFVKFNKGGI